MIEGIEEGKEAQLLELEASEMLFKSLDNIVDANGKIKEGMEGRVDFILGDLNSALGTEYTRNGNIIQNYKDMQTEVKNLMEDLKKKIKLEAYEEAYKESIKQQLKLQREREALLKEQNKLQEEGNKLVENWYGWLNIPAQHEYNKAHEELTEALKENGTAFENTTTDLQFYETELGKLQTTTDVTTQAQEKAWQEYQTEMASDIDLMNQSIDNHSLKTSELKDGIKSDTSGMKKSYNEVQKTIEKTYTEAGLDIQAFANMSRTNASRAGREWNIGFKTNAGVTAEELLPSDTFANLGTQASNKFWSMFRGARVTSSSSSAFGEDLISITPFATGGLPDMGEIFVAREAGPELVGKIGNSNAVMNNNQIVEAVSTGVARAVASVMGNNRGNNQPIQLLINEREIAYAIRGGQARIDDIFGTT